MQVAMTLREQLGLPAPAGSLSAAALILLECQNTYLRGALALEGAEAAIAEASLLLTRARDLGAPVVHVQHRGAPGSVLDISQECGRIAEAVEPRGDEPVILKGTTDAFAGTGLHELLQGLGAQRLILAGFMTHLCVQATARSAFDLGYACTIVARATATRALRHHSGKVLSAQQVQETSLAAIVDLHARVVDWTEDLTR